MTRFIAVLLAAITAVPPAGVAQTGVAGPNALEIQVLEGEGRSFPLGSKAQRGVTVLITDEAKRPVPGVTVGFTLPVGGPGGVFATGARTEIVTTQADGKASVRGMQWNQTAGPFEIRITAAKGQTRAGMLLPASLVDPVKGQVAAPAGRAGPAPASMTAAQTVPTTTGPTRPASASTSATGTAVQITQLNASSINTTSINTPSRQAKNPNKTSHKWLWVGLAVGGAAAAGAVGFINKSGTTASGSGVSIGTPTVTLGH